GGVPHAKVLESPRDGDAGEQRKEARFSGRRPKEPGREEARPRRGVPGAAAGALPGALHVRDDDGWPGSRGRELPRAVLAARQCLVVFDLAADLERQRAPDRRDRQERQAHQRAAARTRGTRTISSIVPSLGLRVYTSANPMMSDGGSWYDAVIAKLPFAGAPAVAVVNPLARTRPAVSVTCQMSAASNTLASPLIVSGLRTWVLASGSFTRIPPRAERSGVGTGLDVGVGLGVGLGLAVDVGVADRTGVGVGVVTTIRLSTHPAPR